MIDVFAGREQRDTAVAYLHNALASGNITHAYLLTGPQASGKEDVALRFAAALVAAGNQQEFDTARRLAHPDVHVYEPEGVRTYSVAAVRELVADTMLAPIRAPRKVYIVSQAEALNASSANALLKTLEEPPSDTVLILLAPGERSVLETIRSRCEHLAFAGGDTRPDPDQELFGMLRDVAGGCGNRTLLAHAKRFAERAKAGGEDIERERAQELQRNADFLSPAAVKDYEKRTGTLVKAAQQQELVRQLDVLDAWLRDCLLVQQGAPELAAYADEAAATMQVASSAGPSGVLDALQAVATCRARVTYNVSPQLAAEALFLEIRSALADLT